MVSISTLPVVFRVAASFQSRFTIAFLHTFQATSVRQAVATTWVRNKAQRRRWQLVYHVG